VSVSALVLSGVANAWYLVGDLPALIATEYGRLLLAKLALFGAMLALAAVNRWKLSPRVIAGDDGALRSLSRNAMLETAAGIAVIAIVGVLGITIPAAHRHEHELHSATSRAIITDSFAFEAHHGRTHQARTHQAR
jgi:putative copper resistance protein D